MGGVRSRDRCEREDVPLKKYFWNSEMRTSTVVKRRATRKEKGKAIMTEEGTLGRKQVPSAKAWVSAHLEKPAEVLTVSSATEKDPMTLEKIAERVVEDVARETSK